MNEAIAVESLKEAKKVFDKHKITFWLDFGTLLGAVRDKKFIPWDTDIDLGIWAKDFNKFAIACLELKSKGFRVVFGINSANIKYGDGKECLINISAYCLDNKNQATKKCVVHPKERYFDGVKLVKRKTQMRIRMIRSYTMWLLSAPSYSGDNPKFMPNRFHFILVKICRVLPTWSRKLLISILDTIFQKFGCQHLLLEIPSHYFKNLSTIKFYEMEFKIPSSTEGYLTYKYGKDWRIPKMSYIYYKENGSIVKK